MSTDNQNREIKKSIEAITSLREAIQQAEQAKPMGWMMRSGHGTHYQESVSPEMQALTFAGKPMWVPLYTAPPPRQPLTAMEVYDVVRDADLDWHTGFALGEDENRFVVLARAIEAAHGIKEKNT